MSAAVGEHRHHGRRARDWVVLGLCILLGGLAGLGYYLLKPPVYTAQTTVLVLPTAAGLDSSVSSANDIQIDTEAEIANSAQVAAAAAADLAGRVTPEVLREDSEVTVTPNSQVLTITVEADDPALARDGAQAIAQAYLDQRSAQAKATVKVAADTLSAKQKALSDQQKEQSDALKGANDPAQAGLRASLQANLALTNAQLADVNGRLVALQVQSTEGGQVISAAALPEQPTSPILWIDVAAGLAIGALAGSGLMLLVQRRREAAPAAVPAAAPAALPAVAAVVPAAAPPARPQPAAPPAPAAVPVPEPAATASAKPTAAGKPAAAAAVATGRPRGAAPDSGLQVLASLDLGERGVPSTEDHQSLRALCRAIGDRQDRPGPLVLVGVDYHVLMTEAAFAFNDAWVAEYGGNALVLADADTPALPTRPSLDGRGLTDVLGGEWPAHDTVTALEGGGGVVLGPGLDDTELPPATQRHRLQSLWRDLEKTYGAAIVEVQVPFESPLAQNIVQTAGPLVVVVKGGLSQQQDLAYAIEQLTWLGLSTHVVGIVSVTGRSRTGTAPAVDLTPTAKPEPKTAAAASSGTAMSSSKASKSTSRQTGDAADGLARPGAGRAGS